MFIKLVTTIIVTFISYINVSLIYKIITKSNSKIKIWHYILMLAITLINTLVIMKLPVGFKTIFNLLCLLLINKLIYKDKMSDNIYYVMVIWTVGIILDMIFMALFSILLNKILEVFPNSGMAIISLMLQIVYNLFFRIKFVSNFCVKLKNKIDVVDNVVWLFILSVFLIALFSILAFINLNSFNNTLMIVLIFLIVVSILIFFIKNISDKKIYQQAINNLLKNNKYYIELNSKNSVFKHNIIHQLNSIKSVTDKKTKQLIDDLINEYHMSDTSKLNVDSLPNGINGLIYSYIYTKDYSKLNLAINNYVDKDLFNILTPRNYNKLCEAIGICLDNAVNASLSSEDKILQITVKEDDKNIIIKIINTFSSSLEVDKLGTKDYTTKNNGHGIGLNSIIKKRNLKVKTTIINNMFESIISVKKK